MNGPDREPPARVTPVRRRRRGALITGFPVMIDACVLVNSTIRDVVLWAGHLALFRPVCSADVLSEVQRTLVADLKIKEARAQYLIDRIVGAFPEALVDGYQALIPSMTNDPKDRHVLAAAVIGRAQLIVTQNVRDFPEEALRAYRIEVCPPDDFMRDLLDIDPDRMIEVIETMSEARKFEPRTVDEVLEAISHNGCPGFADDMRHLLEAEYADR